MEAGRPRIASGVAADDDVGQIRYLRRVEGRTAIHRASAAPQCVGCDPHSLWPSSGPQWPVLGLLPIIPQGAGPGSPLGRTIRTLVNEALASLDGRFGEPIRFNHPAP